MHSYIFALAAASMAIAAPSGLVGRQVNATGIADGATSGLGKSCCQRSCSESKLTSSQAM